MLERGRQGAKLQKDWWRTCGSVWKGNVAEEEEEEEEEVVVLLLLLLVVVPVLVAIK